MDDLVAPAQLGVFILDRIEAVRAGGDDLLDAVAVQYGDVLPGQRLEEEFVSDPAGRIARASLLFSQDREINPATLQKLGEGRRHLLVSLIKGRGAPHPIEDLRRPVCRHGLYV